MAISQIKVFEQTMTQAEKNWTGNIHLGAKVDIDVVLKQLCHAFNSSPYFKHNDMLMRVVDGQIEAYIEMQPFMIGNVAFQILHGGVAVMCAEKTGGFNLVNYRHSSGVYHEQETEDLHRRI